MNGKKFEIQKETVTKFQKEQFRKEKYLFLALCAEEDRQKIEGESELRISDFQRICFLLNALGLKNYLVAFEAEHPDMINQLGTEIERRLEEMDARDVEWEARVTFQWLIDFCNQLPTPKLRRYIKELFEM